MKKRTPKKRTLQFRYQLYRLQQHLAITSREAKALLVLLSFLLLGIIVTEIQKHRPAFPSDIYAETDSLFLQATAALHKREQRTSRDSSTLVVDTTVIDTTVINTTGNQPSDPLIAFFKPVFPININTASPSDLEQLPRIGPKMAQRIITFRTNYGPFHNISELMKVKGIGEKTLDQLRDKVSVEIENNP